MYLCSYYTSSKVNKTLVDYMFLRTRTFKADPYSWFYFVKSKALIFTSDKRPGARGRARIIADPCTRSMCTYGENYGNMGCQVSKRGKQNFKGIQRIVICEKT